MPVLYNSIILGSFVSQSYLELDILLSMLMADFEKLWHRALLSIIHAKRM